jgi:hypothetical protein
VDQVKLSDNARRIGNYTALAVQLDNGLWVGLVVADYEQQWHTDEDALRYATQIAIDRKRSDELALEVLRKRAPH